MNSQCPSSMRAFCVNGNDLEYNRDYPLPTISDDEVLVKIKACGICNMDRKCKQGHFKDIETPKILGFHVSGIIVELGKNVIGFAVEDYVIAISPLDRGGGLAEYISVNQMNIVKLPSNISTIDTAGFIYSGIKAYTCLYYKMKINAGDVILLLNGSSPEGQLLIQLAKLSGALIIVTANTDEEYSLLQSLDNLSIKSIIRNPSNIEEKVMEITGGLGVDCIIDYYDNSVYSTKDLIKCLSVHGTWITQESIQLDPPDSQSLLKRSATVSFLYDPCWTLAPTQQGKLLHIIENLLAKISQGKLKMQNIKIVALESINEALLESEKSFSQLVIKM